MNAEEAWDNACELILGKQYKGEWEEYQVVNFVPTGAKRADLDAYNIKLGEVGVTAHRNHTTDGNYRFWATGKGGKNIFNGGTKPCIVGKTLEEAAIQAVLELKRLGLFPEE